MSRTLEDIVKDLRAAREEEKTVIEVYKNISDKTRKLHMELERYKLDNEMYDPISELSNHTGKIIHYIDLVELNEDGTLKVEYMYNDSLTTERFMVNKNGHIYYFDPVKSVNYNEKIGRYILRFHNDGRETEHNYIGFMSLDFLDGEYKDPDILFKEIFGET